MRGCIKTTLGPYQMGGTIGEFPTLLFGTIFFEGQTLLTDPAEGIIDKNRALHQIQGCAEACSDVAVPLCLDVVAETPEAMERELEFVAEHTSLPFLVDASDEEVRFAGLRKAAGLDCLDRSIYNSIGEDSSEEELEALERYTPAGILVRAMDPLDFGVASAQNVVEKIRMRLSPALRTKLLLDVGFLDEVSVKISCDVAAQLRERCGLPVGGAPCNGLQMWKRLKSDGELPLLVTLASTLGYCSAFGLDFVFIGPLRFARAVSIGQAAADVYNRYYLRSCLGSGELTNQHPIRAMFA